MQALGNAKGPDDSEDSGPTLAKQGPLARQGQCMAHVMLRQFSHVVLPATTVQQLHVIVEFVKHVLRKPVDVVVSILCTLLALHIPFETYATCC